MPSRSPLPTSTLRSAIVLALLTSAFLALAVPARAAVTSSVAGGVLTINGDADGDSIGVGCVAGGTKVTGNNPGSGAAACNSITSVVVNGAGNNDLIDLSPMNTIAFNALTSTSIAGGTGADTITGSPVTDQINGEDGDDYLTGGNGNDTIDGGIGFDGVTSGAAQASTTVADSQMVGSTSGTDGLFGLESATVIVSSNGAVDASNFSGITSLSTPSTGTGETFIGGSGADQIVAAGGADVVVANGANDMLIVGNETVVNASYDGGTGTDTLLFDTAEATLADDHLSNGAAIHALAGIEKVQVTLMAPGLLDLRGFSGRSLIFGSTDNELVLGGSGRDTLRGGDGTDTLKGFGGRDSLNGGRGSDLLVGGAGRDTCVGGPGVDTIKSC